MEPIFCLPTFSKHVACPGVEMILTMTFHWKHDWYFFSQKTSAVNSFLNRVGPLCPRPFLSLLGFCLFWACVCSYNLLTFMCDQLLVWKAASFKLSTTVACYKFSASSSSWISNLWDRRFGNLLFNIKKVDNPIHYNCTLF